jgi:LPS O-antigen subunit length determinant protein (WzzB/FepE family)
MEPLIANYENAVNALYEAAGNVDEEAFGKLVSNFEAAEEGLRLFADYDNVPTELQQRAQAAEAKLQDLLNAMEAAE